MKGNTKITKLVTSNFCRVSFVSANLADVTVIAGENGQGKTSFLNSLIALFDGNKVPDHAVKNGTEGFKIVGTFEDETGARFFLTRQQKAGGTQSVSLTREDGQPIPQPATAIKSMLGAAGIAVVSPMEFAVMDRAKQGAILRKLAGVDTSEVDAQLTRAEEARKEKNAVRDSIRARMGASDAPMPGPEMTSEKIENLRLAILDLLLAESNLANPPADADPAKLAEEVAICRAAVESYAPKEVDGAEVRAKYTEAVNRNSEVAKHQTAVETAVKAKDAAGVKVMGLLKELEELKREIEQADQELEKASEQADQAIEAAEKFGPATDVEPLAAEMNSLDATNKQRSDTAQWVKLFTEWTANESARVALENELDRLKSERVKLFNSATFAVEGLTLGEDGEPLMNGLPLTSASEAEKILIACEIAMASAGQFKGMAIRGAQAMTSKTQAILIERARARGAQLFLEIPEYEGNETTIVLEDGEVSGQQPKLMEAGA